MRKRSSSLTAFDLSFRGQIEGKLERIVNDALSRGRVLVVSTDREAADLAITDAKVKPDVIKVVDRAGAGQGVIFPGWIASQVARESGRRAASLLQAVKILAKEDLVADRDHLHEWLNFARPKPVECPGGPPGSKGRHLTFGAVPCRNHR